MDSPRHTKTPIYYIKTEELIAFLQEKGIIILETEVDNWINQHKLPVLNDNVHE